ncbi:ImmA/IrrE family metallo-endopeptidase [Priestia megaterium]|uniref:ImmA/IrrE family metallo-endopeptidase n=1 Tax=Priestia megaterium TaxID=1404 RepID=UPI002D80765B|nr:hypothetical protein [Priestia megaterium]MEB4857441.1 hypothetical protein [Priestia megaterium]
MFKRSEKIQIHGVTFHGVMSAKQKAALHEIANVTDEKDWDGLKGVYCLGSVKVQGKDVLGVYYGQFNDNLPKEKRKLQFEIDYIKYTVTECPIVFIDTTKNKKPHQFAFIILHELGHHVDRMTNGTLLKEGNRTQEMFANTYALEKYSKIEKFQTKKLKKIAFLEESLTQWNKTPHPGAYSLRVQIE